MKIHYEWAGSGNTSSQSDDGSDQADATMDPLFPWKLKPCMDPAKKWISQEGLTFTIVFRQPAVQGKLPGTGLLVLTWIPLTTQPLDKSLLGSWLKRNTPKVKSRQRVSTAIRKRLVNGLVNCAQETVVLAIFNENDDYFTTENYFVDKEKEKLSCKKRCREYLTHELLDPQVMGYKYIYLSESVSTMISIVKEEGLDWFLAFKLRYKKVFTKGHTNVNDLLAMYRQKNGEIPADVDIDKLEESLMEDGVDNAFSVTVSSWAYLCATRRNS